MTKKDNFWHFIRKSERIKVQSFEVSKVIAFEVERTIKTSRYGQITFQFTCLLLMFSSFLLKNKILKAFA